MNKRIKEIAKQANEETKLLFIMEYGNFESKLLEKFAQLIISEHKKAIAEAWYATGQDIRGGNLSEVLEISDKFLL